MRIGINLHPMISKGGAEKVLLVTAEVLSSAHKVDIITCGRINKSEIESFFGVNLKGVKIRELADEGGVFLRRIDDFLSPLREGNRYKKIYTTTLVSKLTREYDLFINGESGDIIQSHARHSIFYVFSPWLPEQLNTSRNVVHCLYSVPYLLWKRFYPTQDFDSYSVLLTSSLYVKRYIKVMWNRDSEVLSPPVDVHGIIPGEKRKKIILSVGRFFRTGHEKKQHFLIDCFKKIYNSGAEDWEFHLAGYVNDWDYVLELERVAEGYPIAFHFNMSYSELRKLYGEASIFWHAAGFGEDLEKYPERAEHFGITTVEAMAGGAVPVVIKRGGQPEIVDHMQNGFLWDTREDLIEYSLLLMRDARLLNKLSKSAVEKSKAFSREAFGDRLMKIIDDLVYGREHENP